MYFQKMIICLLVVCSTGSIMAQQGKPTAAKKRRFAVYAGIGPNYYFNNLVIGKNLVNSLNYSIAGRIMWEPEHLLSVGIESGYYRLYTLNGNGAAQAHFANSAIPIQIVLSMKFLKAFYFNFSLGQTKLINKVTRQNTADFNTSAWSLADFAGTLGYRYTWKSRISLAAETKFFYSTGFIDRNIALIFMVGYKF